MNIRINNQSNSLREMFADVTPASEAEFKKLFIVDRLIDLIKEKRITRTELATRMGVQPSRITALLNGTGNLTIETLVRAGLALGSELHQTYAPIGHEVRWTSYAPSTSTRDFIASVALPSQRPLIIGEIQEYLPSAPMKPTRCVNPEPEFQDAA